jgi:hypothetical protein
LMSAASRSLSSLDFSLASALSRRECKLSVVT